MKESILFVDDNDSDLEFLERSTRSLALKYNCIFLNSYSSAHKYLKNNSVSYLITDYYLGDGEAIELIKEFPFIPAIIITGSSDIEIVIEILRQGASDFVVKDCEGKYLKVLQVMIERTIEVENRNKELIQFVYTVSHDIRSPLRCINNLIKWIEDEIDEPSNVVQEYFSMIKNKTIVLDDLINGLLNYTRLGKQKLEKEIINTYDFVSEIISGYDPEVHFYIDPQLPEVCTYKVLLYQTFSNLIDNAVKHNNKSVKKVKVGFSSKATETIFSIDDNGTGIPKKLHNKVFQLFQTASENSSKDCSGIGLAICKKVMADIGGSIWIKFKEEEEGVKFCFSIPVTQPNIISGGSKQLLLN